MKNSLHFKQKYVRIFVCRLYPFQYVNRREQIFVGLKLLKHITVTG